MMVSSALTVWTGLSTILGLVLAQTSSLCNPTNTTCPANVGLSDKTFSTDFTQGESSSLAAAAYTTVTYSDQGAAFTVNTKNDAPTLSTDFYFFFGYVEVKMKAAPGTGIVSSIVLQSDDLDEIDWEFLGGDAGAVQTNFFGKGDTTSYDRMASVAVSAATTTYHTYALNWTSSSLTWLIDGTPVRTLLYSDALAHGGKNYPQTPCQLKLGAWAGGASENEGTVTWAGGPTDFSQGPFTMYVESISITNYNPGSSYTYSDKSGDYTSIVVGDPTDSGSNSTSTTSAGSISSSVVPTTLATQTLTPSSSATALAASTEASSTASFVEGANDASRQIGASIISSKIPYLLLAVLGGFSLA